MGFLDSFLGRSVRGAERSTATAVERVVVSSADHAVAEAASVTARREAATGLAGIVPAGGGTLKGAFPRDIAPDRGYENVMAKMRAYYGEGKGTQGWRTRARQAEVERRADIIVGIEAEKERLARMAGKPYTPPSMPVDTASAEYRRAQWDNLDSPTSGRVRPVKGRVTAKQVRAINAQLDSVSVETSRQYRSWVKGERIERGLTRARGRYDTPEAALGGILSRSPKDATSREWGQVKPLFKDLTPGKTVEAAVPRNEAGAVNTKRLNSFTKRIKGKTGQSVSYSVDEAGQKVYFSIGEQTKAARGKTAKGTKAGKGTKGKTSKKGRKAGGFFGLSQGIGGFINDMADRAAAGGFENVATKLLRPWGAALSDKKRYKPWLAGTLYGAYTGYAMIADGDQPLALG